MADQATSTMPRLSPETAPLRQSDSPAHPLTRSSEAARRKRERDRECQRKKRQRDRQYIERLQMKIRELQCQLEIDRPRKACSAQATTYPADESTATPASQRPSASPMRPIATEDYHVNHRSQSLGSSVQLPTSPIGSRDKTLPETVTVSLPVLESCLAVPQWARLPLHGLSLMPDPRRCVRGSELPRFILQMGADASLQHLCPPTPKVIDILYGGSKNPLADLIVNECSKEPLLPPERLAVSLAIYKYCRVSSSFLTTARARASSFLSWITMLSCTTHLTSPTVAHMAVERKLCVSPQVHVSDGFAAYGRAPMVH